MYRVRLHYSHVDWAFHRRCVALQKYAPDDFEVDIAQWHPCVWREPLPVKPYDLILNLVPDHEVLRKHVPRTTVIVGGLNVGWGHHDERLRMQASADHVIVNNRDLWERLDRPDGMTWISNGVDLDTFRVTRPVAERKPKVLWTGCSYHCRETSIKGWDSVLLPLVDLLSKDGIGCDFRIVDAASDDKRSTEEMVEWYNTGTIYICTSSSEGTPNTCLEAATCGNVILTTAVGNMPELIRQHVNGEIIHSRRGRGAGDFYQAIKRCIPKTEEMADAMIGDMQAWDWCYAAHEYYNLFRKLIDA